MDTHLHTTNSNSNNFIPIIMNYLDRADDAYEEMRDEGWRWGRPYTKLIELPRYKQNLRLEKEYIQGDYVYKVYSYDTLVAEYVEGKPMVQFDWSHVTKATSTTQKHINYVANHLGVEVVKLADLQ